MDYDLRSRSLYCRLHSADALILADLHDGVDDQALLAAPAPFCQLHVDGRELVAPTIDSSIPCQLQVCWQGQQARAELRLVANDAGLSWQLHAEGTGLLQVRFPFLAGLQAPSATSPGQRPDDRSFCDPQRRPIMQHADWPLPLLWRGQQRSLSLLSDAADLLDEGVACVLAAESSLCCEAELLLHDGGWRESFGLFRERIRRRFDLRQYQRPELGWYQTQLVQHFSFAFGRELLNLESGQFEIDRLLDEGERDFGGYDGILFWGVYPRIGLDERTQWEFYDDLPGGRDGMRQLARRCRERGVRFFVPYKPWDRAADLHGRSGAPDHEELARLVADCEADGVFLDTMSAISPEFRAAIDERRSGVVFCSEGRAKGSAFEIITGAWDQTLYRDSEQGNWSAHPEAMPALDLWRFMFPEHRQFVINRHAMGDDRWRIIQRGFWSGTGWVVWQDIFGLVMPFTPAEAALLTRCRTILARYREVLLGEQPTPLVTTLVEGIYANEFAGRQGRLWTLYNAHDDVVDAPVLEIVQRANTFLYDAWNECEAEATATGSVRLRIAPRSLGALVELPRCSDEEQQ